MMNVWAYVAHQIPGDIFSESVLSLSDFFITLDTNNWKN